MTFPDTFKRDSGINSGDLANVISDRNEWKNTIAQSIPTERADDDDDDDDGGGGGGGGGGDGDEIMCHTGFTSKKNRRRESSLDPASMLVEFIFL